MLRETLDKNKDKGITLIALVVSIIVLLVLAGVSISMLTGQNGILTRAAESKVKTEMAGEKEKIQIAIVSLKMREKLTSRNINIEMQNEKINIKSLKEKGNEWILETSHSKYEIQENGLIESITGNASSITKSCYGKNVEYELPRTSTYNSYTSGWQIVYADDVNVYLISKDPVKIGALDISEYKVDNGYVSSLLDDTNRFPAAQEWLSMFRIDNKWYESNSNSTKGMLYMLDSGNVWNKEFSSEKAKYSIGGPTMEFVVKSLYDNNTNKKITVNEEDGYLQYISPVISGDIRNNSALWYYIPNSQWIAASYSSDEVYYIDNGNLWLRWRLYSNDFQNAFRPIICLKSSVILEFDNENQVYRIR